MKISFISPHRRHPGPEERHIGAWKTTICLPWGLKCSHLATKESGNDFGFVEMWTACFHWPPPHQMRMIILIHTGYLHFVIWLTLQLSKYWTVPQEQNTYRTNHRRNSYRRISKESKLRYRRYNKAINEMAVKQLSTALLPHLNTQEQRVINLLSTEEKDGKTHVARLIRNIGATST